MPINREESINLCDALSRTSYDFIPLLDLATLVLMQLAVAREDTNELANARGLPPPSPPRPLSPDQAKGLIGEWEIRRLGHLGRSARPHSPLWLARKKKGPKKKRQER
jgi:hypothetical protein